MYEDKPEVWTSATETGRRVHCVRLTSSSVIDKESKLWNDLVEIEKLEVEDGDVTLIGVLLKRFEEMSKLESLLIVWTKQKTLPPSLLKLISLHSLTLQHNHLHSVSGIEMLTKLQFFDVSHNSIGTLPKSIGELRNLRVMNLSGNKLRILPDGIGNLSRLETLNCSSNHLTSLPDSVVHLTEVTCLDISGNKITALPENFGKLSKLEDLRATGNYITILPKSFAQLNNLRSLLLGSNRFLYVPMELAALNRLESLNLRSNHILTMECPLPSVKSLVLDRNRVSSLGNGIGRSTNLEFLSLERNMLKTISMDIANLTKLRSIQLSGNPLEEIPDDVDRLFQARKVNVHINVVGPTGGGKKQTTAAGKPTMNARDEENGDDLVQPEVKEVTNGLRDQSETIFQTNDDKLLQQKDAAEKSNPNQFKDSAEGYNNMTETSSSQLLVNTNSQTVLVEVHSEVTD